MGATFSQLIPPTPGLTEQNLPSQKGKVFIVTCGTSGIGYHLASILFQAGAKVYIAGRCEAKARQSIEEIKSSVNHTSSVGQLEFLPLELDDLTTIKSSAEDFKSKESKLDGLWNNAGVSMPPMSSVSKQGHELQLATNCLGPSSSLSCFSRPSKMPLTPQPQDPRGSYGQFLHGGPRRSKRGYAHGGFGITTRRPAKELRYLKAR